ncbi:flagellar biosynthesis protein FlhF [Ideonella sp. B508-1]|uniref:flagellar biosynthesis protein FlhF n=1 Tax=Ideonella sp. B508-1 TaxID=137716 RepID=UPI00034D9908|nr:flagellar biosynthesis protein FlhF [Ideonella sp. B508-1]
MASPSAPARAGRGESLAARAERQQADRGGAAQRRLADRVPPEAMEGDVNEDVERMAMSTLSFQDYVRDRMLRRRQAALEGDKPSTAAREAAPMVDDEPPRRAARPAEPLPEPGLAARAAAPQRRAPARPLNDGPAPELPVPTLSDVAGHEQIDMVHELRAMKGLIEERFGTLAFMEKLQREPRQAQLSQKLMDVGFSPALTRKLLEALPASASDELAWATSVLERNLLTDEREPALEEKGGVYALIGSTGVGKTTSTAKLAAAFATAHGANQLGLITLDAYRVGAHEQLRAYGRILGVPVHTAHDRASLEDLLDLLSGKKMVLIDTAGMAQRDSRCRELLEMLSHRAIQRLLVINAAAQGETLDDVITAWRAAQCKGVILSKIDEAVKLAPALDAVIRHRLKVVGVANGQRVPEDWHRLSANALLHRAMKGGGSPAYRVDVNDVQLVLSGLQRQAAGLQGLHF